MNSVAAAHQRTIDAITGKITETVGRVNAAIIANDAKAQASHKRTLASLHDDLKEAQRHAEAASIEQVEADRAAVEADGVAIAEQTIARVNDIIAPYGVAPISVGDDRFGAAAHALSLARQKLAHVMDKVEVAGNKLDEVESKISELNAKRDAITAARLAGADQKGSADEFVALSADIVSLSSMLEPLRNTLSSVDSSNERTWVAKIEQEVKALVSTVAVDAVQAKVRDAEQALLAAVRGAYAVGVAQQPTRGSSVLAHY
ncbi:hypothetical protein [Paraburkholderia rhynchosiae]|uniref:Uncharacterized protein n=1 Tax=Paraburkholderia rhynchosiae TaxID=487049 RepID=A0A2N7WHH1_9BURK|nr:hypothetical protein [Paraburkholderia rhynchosiae]PMS28870.1 hypothetical protein C0Z16_20780 [Paraburkholderia rhynchosiae]CAB3665182.1 hypothetical protein LMG27174_01842 [Paraburkholderia rhynchosiae]